MAHTFVSLNIHIIFTTKNRSPWITPAIQEDIYSYIAIQGNKAGCKILAIGGIEDHIHILLSLHPAVALSDWIRDIKIKSAVWAKNRMTQLTSFNWQRGFAAYSASCQNIAAIQCYIRNQANHHKGMTCEEELQKMAEKYDEICTPDECP